MSQGLLIKNAHVIDPANSLNDIRDILIEGNKISRIAQNINFQSARLIDARAKIVMPGIVDMHVHLRQPGREDKETIDSGTKAALWGGVTSVLAMPNTTIPIDCVKNAKLLKTIIKKSAHVNVFIAAAITRGRLGKELTDIAKLKKEGIISLTDDGASVDREKILLGAFKTAKRHNILLICHCEDKAISNDGVVNRGIISTRLGLKGAPKEAEYKRVARDIRLAEKADAPVHIVHVSCEESVELIAKAKKNGVRVSAETAPHYFCFNEQELLGYNANMKVNPPLRSSQDVEAIKQGLKSGIIDAIASDHAPHTEDEKDVEFERAEFGAIGLETELAAGITELVNSGILTWTELAEKFTTNPAKILGLDKGSLGKGKDADLIIVDPEKEWILKKEDIRSKSKNSPFIGRKLKGVVEYTILGGKVVYQM